MTAEGDIEPIKKIWFTGAAEAIEAVQAAETLGFGVALHNESAPDDSASDEDEPGTVTEWWIVEIYPEVPTGDPESDVA